MPLRDHVIWGGHNPFSDPRLTNLDTLVRNIRRYRRMPPNVQGGGNFLNLRGDLPPKPLGYYREYDLVAPAPGGRGKLRMVLGNGGEVYITGNHYDDFRQVINMPE
jgi:guanyl-specific ribonuclease Sa